MISELTDLKRQLSTIKAELVILQESVQKKQLQMNLLIDKINSLEQEVKIPQKKLNQSQTILTQIERAKVPVQVIDTKKITEISQMHSTYSNLMQSTYSKPNPTIKKQKVVPSLRPEENNLTIYCGICHSYAHHISECSKRDRARNFLADYKCLICSNDNHVTEDCDKLNRKGPCILCYHHRIERCRKVQNFLEFQRNWKMVWETVRVKPKRQNRFEQLECD